MVEVPLHEDPNVGGSVATIKVYSFYSLNDTYMIENTNRGDNRDGRDENRDGEDKNPDQKSSGDKNEDKDNK